MKSPRVNHFSSAKSPIQADGELSPLDSSCIHLTQKHRAKMLNCSAHHELRANIASSKPDIPNPAGLMLHHISQI